MPEISETLVVADRKALRTLREEGRISSKSYIEAERSLAFGVGPVELQALRSDAASHRRHQPNHRGTLLIAGVVAVVIAAAGVRLVETADWTRLTSQQLPAAFVIATILWVLSTAKTGYHARYSL